MNNMVWHPASEKPKVTAVPYLLAVKQNLYDEHGRLLQGITPTTCFLGCYADGQFWDEIGERLPDGVTVTHWMRIYAPEE